MDRSFPSSLPAFQRAFSDEASCRSWIATVRTGAAFRCPNCGHEQSWASRTRTRLTCRQCRRQVSLTSGTVLANMRLPLRTVFLAAWLSATTPGLSAMSLAHQLGIGRYKTAWLLSAKLRRAMTRAVTVPLSGTIEVDEAWFGGPQSASSRQQIGRSALMVLALAEARPGGKVRLVRIADNRAPTLAAAIASVVAPGSTIVTDGWRAYSSLSAHGYRHTRLAHPPGWQKTGNRSTPHADQLISAAKRWLVGTYQKPAREHLAAYLGEFSFRREFADSPAIAAETLLRALVSTPPTPRRRMVRAADLSPVIVGSGRAPVISRRR